MNEIGLGLAIPNNLFQQVRDWIAQTVGDGLRVAPEARRAFAASLPDHANTIPWALRDPLAAYVHQFVGGLPCQGLRALMWQMDHDVGSPTFAASRGRVMPWLLKEPPAHVPAIPSPPPAPMLETDLEKARSIIEKLVGRPGRRREE